MLATSSRGDQAHYFCLSGFSGRYDTNRQILFAVDKKSAVPLTIGSLCRHCQALW